jgi:uroporphyrin-III C-methyltransferase/precorrin-2 dehydrogenase/sirohydrochlorin ferrochelatase
MPAIGCSGAPHASDSRSGLGHSIGHDGAVRYPLMLDLTGRPVLVVGGGVVGSRRALGLLAAGALVTVVAPVISAEIDASDATVVRRGFVPSDVSGAWLVLACADDAEVNATVAQAAEEHRVWCVRADDGAASPAWLSAVSRVDEVTVAVSANADPARARTLRDAIETGLRSGELTARRGRSSGGGVILVGGGPGDPDLLTVKGLRALLDADVVVTDRLGPTDLLHRLPPDVEVIDVGKTPRGPATSQEAICALLVEHARAGRKVVRLKGGDPFVLGRGTEEVDACVAAGLSVEVIPGVTSATAAATLVGIPLTERGTAQQFTVVSGHLPPGDSRSTVDWESLGRGDATIVLLMAVANLEKIAVTLIDDGRPPSTPAAIVENASLPQQRVIRGRLDEIAGLAVSLSVVPPAVVIIGAVVRL